MLVGEAPGFHEDKQGVPFVGQAGQLLDRLLAGIGLERSHIYLANVIKCRPPGNRDPQPEEIAACEPHLFRQVELVRPAVVATLGNFATKLLSGKPHGITRVHGQEHEVTLGTRQVLLYPLYHPAAALYTPSMLTVLEQDFARIPELLGRAEPQRRAACDDRSTTPCRTWPSSSRSRPRRYSSACSDLDVDVLALTSSSAAETEALGGALAAALVLGDVVLVSGELGTGKTTLVRGAARALGVTDPVTSPTFTIGHRYRGRVDVSHLDLYRFHGLSAAEWGDLEPYFDDAVVFVEWPEAGAGALPEARLSVVLDPCWWRHARHHDRDRRPGAATRHRRCSSWPSTRRLTSPRARSSTTASCSASARRSPAPCSRTSTRCFARPPPGLETSTPSRSAPGREASRARASGSRSHGAWRWRSTFLSPACRRSTRSRLRATRSIR